MTHTHTHTHTHTQLIGLGLFIFGIYLLASQNNLAFLTGTEFASGGVLILIAGFISFVIALIGVLAAAGMWPVLFIIVRLCGCVCSVCGCVCSVCGCACSVCGCVCSVCGWLVWIDGLCV